MADLSPETRALLDAVHAGRADEVALLLAGGALDPRVDPAVADNCAIRLAAENGHAAVVALLLGDPRVDPAARDNYAIRWAAAYGFAEVVALLLADPRVDPAADNNFAIRWAADNGHAAAVALLLGDPRVDPVGDNNFAIRRAAWWGHAGTVALLLGDLRVDPAALDLPEFAAIRARPDVAGALARRRRWGPLRGAWAAAVVAGR
jgi:hypothetical protein